MHNATLTSSFICNSNLVGVDEAFIPLSQMTPPHRLMADHAREAIFVA